MQANYFFIDGSALMAQIRQLRRARPIFGDRKLCPKSLIEYFMRSIDDLHAGEYKRATFYFADGDDANVSSHFEMPNPRAPGVIRDLYFKYCGHKLKKSADFDKFVEEKVPQKFAGRFAKSEKGIDIEMCCDALKLASAGRIDRLFLLTNDSDFIPLARTIKEFGANISILHLLEIVPPNRELLLEADSYDVVGSRELSSVFVPIPTESEIQAEDAAIAVLAEAENVEEMLSEKPDAEPSDMAKINENGDEA